jgi:hypothetical protein
VQSLARGFRWSLARMLLFLSCFAPFIGGAVVSAQGLPKEAPPDALQRALDMYDDCPESLAHSIEKATQCYQNVKDTVSAFKSADADRRGAAGRLQAECDEKLAGLKKRDLELGRAAKALRKVIHDKQLHTAAKQLKDTNPPSEDPRFLPLKASLEKGQAEVKKRVQLGDSKMPDDPKGALKWYGKARAVNAEAAKDADFVDKESKAREALVRRRR